MIDSFWPFVATFSIGMLSVAVGVYTALSPARQGRVKALARRFSSAWSSPPNVDTTDAKTCSTHYVQGLEHQLELTNTLQRVMSKTAHCPGNSLAVRGKLQRVLEMRQAILTAELSAQEGVFDDTAQPNWKALKKAYNRIIALQKIQVELKSAAPEAKSSPKLHQSNTTKQLAKAPPPSLEEFNQMMHNLNSELQHKVNILNASDRRVKLLEAKLNLAQSQIARMQLKLNPATDDYQTPNLLKRVQ